jgi:hypothetical protein
MMPNPLSAEVGVGWIDGWSSAVSGGRLEAIVGRRFSWSRCALPSTALLVPRIFEPSLCQQGALRTANVKLDIGDLSSLSRLIAPGEVVGEFLSAARRTRHAVFAATEGGTSVFIPAALLIRALWLWSSSALEALMTPNGLDAFLCHTEVEGKSVIVATGPLRADQPSDRHLRTLAWFAQQEDARRSWSSVLTNAHRGAIDLSLPLARLSCWAWGVELEGGLLACELNAVEIQFELPKVDDCISMGKTIWPCPEAPKKRTGLLSF